ncbi:hypothetical protein [Mycolicibacterium setense]|nr:hypothetical protein [Mycolicibacterium setense]
MSTFKVEKIDRNADGTTTLYGTTPDGIPVVHTYQPGEMVTRVVGRDEQ